MRGIKTDQSLKAMIYFAAAVINSKLIPTDPDQQLPRFYADVRLADYRTRPPDPRVMRLAQWAAPQKSRTELPQVMGMSRLERRDALASRHRRPDPWQGFEVYFPPQCIVNLWDKHTIRKAWA